MNKIIPPSDRFWDKVTKGKNGCLIWNGSSNLGYGCFTVRYKSYRAHRFAYESIIGKIPEGLVLDHLCEVKLCVNPAHLEPVTNHENILRSAKTIPGKNIRKTECPKGHTYTQLKSGWRYCKTCRNTGERRKFSERGYISEDELLMLDIQ